MKSFYALYLLAQSDCQPGQLVKDLGIPNSTATRILDHLEAEGLIAREPNRADLRQMVLSLTPAGRTRYQTAWAQYLTCLHQGFGNLPEDVLQRAISALLELEQTLEQHERRPQEAEV
jgi:DNA-binding MarR family transcriptional regulator